jgi:hypothetical protein
MIVTFDPDAMQMDRVPETLKIKGWGCLVPKNFHPKVSYRILRHMYRVLNIDEKKLITQFD